MDLIAPTLKHRDRFLIALKEFRDEDTHGFWDYCMDPTQVKAYIKITAQHAKGLELKEDWVPASTFWLIDNEKWIGHCNIRHRLTPSLEQLGGHIGYAIPPSERQKGYGGKILKLALEKAHDIGIHRAMITCDSDNAASRKIIERNGGVLDEEYEYKGKKVRRYWVA